jgi:hypothetical protein
MFFWPGDEKMIFRSKKSFSHPAKTQLSEKQELYWQWAEV